MKRTWTRIETGTLLKVPDIARFLDIGIFHDINRGMGETLSIGFVPLDNPMSDNFESGIILSGRIAGRIAAWNVRVDRISVPAGTVKIKTDAYIRDGLPDLDDYERKVYAGMRPKSQRTFAEERVRRTLIADTPEAISLIPVYYDAETGILRVLSSSGPVLKYILGWLENVAIERAIERANDERITTGKTGEKIMIWERFAPPRIAAPEDILIEAFGTDPADLLRVIPGSFNGAVNDGDQTEIDPDDIVGMKNRLRHFRRDFLTWLAYKGAADENVMLPEASMDRPSLTVEVSVSKKVTVTTDHSFVDITGLDPVMDISTRAALKSRAKIVRGGFRFRVWYENGTDQINIDLASDLGFVAVDVRAPVARMSDGESTAADADKIMDIAGAVASMAAVEDIVRRLFVAFATLRASRAWADERARMIEYLYSIDDLTTPCP